MCASRRPDDINGFLMERGANWTFHISANLGFFG